MLTEKEKNNILNNKIEIFNIEINATNKSLLVYREENLDHKIMIFEQILNDLIAGREALELEKAKLLAN